MRDELDDARVLEEREAPDRALHQRREALLVRRHGLARVLPGHSVDPARWRVVLVAAEEDPARLALAVDEVVGIAEARHLTRQLVALDGGERDVLVVDRRRRGERADHCRELRRPDAGRVDDDLALDPPALGHDGAHLARRPELDRADAGVGEDRDAQLAGRSRERPGRGVRVEKAVAGQVDRAVQLVR